MLRWSARPLSTPPSTPFCNSYPTGPRRCACSGCAARARRVPRARESVSFGTPAEAAITNSRRAPGRMLVSENKTRVPSDNHLGLNPTLLPVVSFKCEPLGCSDWTRLRFAGSLSSMTIILILAVALLAGVIIQNRWALLLPMAFGACVAVAIAATGHSLSDTPIPFLVVVSTLVMIGGQGLRSRGRAHVL